MIEYKKSQSDIESYKSQASNFREEAERYSVRQQERIKEELEMFRSKYTQEMEKSEKLQSTCKKLEDKIHDIQMELEKSKSDYAKFKKRKREINIRS